MKRVIPLLLILCVIVSGCYREGSLGQTKHYQAAAIVEAAVPYGFTTSPAFDEVMLIEQDCYGRCLFRYNLSYEYEIYIVCQKAERPYAYYYENDCYLVHPFDAADFSDDEVNGLKSVNDWGNPFGETKMRCVNYEEFAEDVPMRTEVDEAVREFLQINSPDVNISLDGLETDSNGNKLVMVFVYDPNHPIEKRQTYLTLIAYQNNSCIVASCEKANSNDGIKSQIIAFKDQFFE